MLDSHRYRDGTGVINGSIPFTSTFYCGPAIFGIIYATDTSLFLRKSEAERQYEQERHVTACCASKWVSFFYSICP